MTEIWINTNNKARTTLTIIAISNTGLMKRKNGSIKVAKLRDKVWFNHEYKFIYRIIAENFIPKTEEDIALGRNFIDHITHNPTDININDVRNLRWCTQKENCNFEETKRNKLGKHQSEETKLKLAKANIGKRHSEETKQKMSAALKGHISGTKGKHWKLVDGKRLYY